MNNENFEFKVGDRVCIEGVLTESIEHPNLLQLKIGHWLKIYFNYYGSMVRDKGNDVILKLIERPKPKLTFEFIGKNLVPMKHLLVDEDGGGRLYLGFNREGKLVTDCCDGFRCIGWSEAAIQDWTYEEYNENNG